MRKIQTLGKSVAGREICPVLHPSDPNYPVPKGSGVNALYNLWDCTNKNTCGKMFLYKNDPAKTTKIVKRNLRLLRKTYSDNEIKRAIIHCGLVARYPFSTQFVRETLELWTHG